MYYQYKVTFWDTYEEEDCKEEGLVYAKDYGEAATKVKNAYGKELIDMYLQEWDAYEVISLDEIKEGFKLT